MNIAFFLLPKNEIVFLAMDVTMRQAFEKMEHHSFAAVPLVDEQGRYLGTITEGDLLREMKKNPLLTYKGMEKVGIKDVTRKFDNKPVRINAEIADLIDLSLRQNFVPVIDDCGVLIGIVRRRELLKYFFEGNQTLGDSIFKEMFKRYNT